MQPVQALNAVRTLLRQLVASRLSGAAAIRAEKPIWDALLGTIDSLLTSNDITLEIQRAGIGVKDVVRHVQSARGWIDYFFRLSASNTMTADQATKYDAYKNRLLGSIDDTIKSIDREQNRIPTQYRAPWLNKAIATVALTIAGYTGLAGTLRAEDSVAQANKPTTEIKDTKDGPKKDEKDYEKLLEDKLKEVKIEEGKERQHYVNGGVEAMKQKDYLRSARFYEHVLQNDQENYAILGNCANAYQNYADELTDSDFRNFVYQKSLKLHLKALDLFMKNRYKQDDKLANKILSSRYGDLAVLYSKIGDSQNMEKYLGLCSKYGTPSDSVLTKVNAVRNKSK